MICKLLLVNPAFAIRHSIRKVLFSGLKFINVAPLNNDSRKVQWSDSYKQPQNEKRQIWSSPPPPTSMEVDTGPHTLKKSLWTLGFAYGQSPHTDDDFCCGKHLFSRWQWTNQYPNHGDLPLYVRQGFSVRVLVIHCLAFLDYDNVINNQK